MAALAIVLAVAFGARIAATVLEPLIPIIAVLIILFVIFRIIIGRWRL